MYVHPASAFKNRNILVSHPSLKSDNCKKETLDIFASSCTNKRPDIH